MEKTDGTTETWRIIGLFPDGENGENGKDEHECRGYTLVHRVRLELTTVALEGQCSIR